MPAIIIGFLICAAAWLTHIVFCVVAAAQTGSAIALLLLGMFFPPVGIIHGIAVWFGFSWV